MKRAIGGFLLLFLLARPVNASVVLNEFLIDPLPQQVELFNTGNEEVDISGFFLDDSGGSTYFTVPENTRLAAQSCIVFSHDFNFNKTSADSARLFDKTAPPTSGNAHAVDSYSYASSPGEGISYQRVPDGEGSWTSKTATFGNKNEDGSSCTSSTVTPPPAGGAAGGPSPTYENIYISEAFVHPATGENEWVELYNDNDFEVTLTNWYIDDSPDAGSAAKQFTLTISAKSYAVYTLSSAMFNNDGDTITLLDADKNIKHQISYTTSEEEQTVGPISFSSNTTCLRNPTKDAANGGCVVATSTRLSPTPTKTPTPTKKAENKNAAGGGKSSSRSTKRSTNNTLPSSAGTLPQAPKVLSASEKKTQPAILLVKTLSFLGVFYALLASSSIVYKLRKKTTLTS